ncbi:MAG TPA: fatty acid desaturase [Polyangiales bacterium]|nr:fatty acid desaturase [Polyangiales bacterium]
MLRYRADLRTLGFLVSYAVLVVGQWVYAPSGILGVSLIVLTCMLSWICAVVAHNTVHSPMFKQRWLNKAFQVWVSLSYGFPISDYVPGHNLSHHRFTQQREDVMRTTRVNFRWNLLNFLLFMPAVTPGILRGNATFKRVMGERAAPWKRQLLIEGIVVWTVKIGLLILDWQKALLYVVLPHLVANWGIVSVNFVQHDGCDPDHPYNHSRNFVGKFFNWWTLNNGYHTIHHDIPGKHWSLLPAAHAERIAPHIDPALDQPSLFLYVFRTVIYPGKRLRYDGTPLVVTAEGPDREWIKPTDAVPEF